MPPVNPVYLDHAATTPVREEVFEAMRPFFGPRFGNPSSTHRWGREARAALDEARERVGRCLGARPDEICFTSGGTEADNLAILGAWRALKAKGRNAVVTTPIEHKAILGAVHQAALEGAEERMLAMTADGVIDPGSFDELVDDAVAVCSMMWVNNEIGSIQPIPELAAKAKRARGRGAHRCSAGIRKDSHRRRRSSSSTCFPSRATRFGAPKGIGALFIRRGTLARAVDARRHAGSRSEARHRERR